MRKDVDLIMIVATMCACTYKYTIEADISRFKLTQVEQTFYSTQVYKYVYRSTNMWVMHLDTIITTIQWSITSLKSQLAAIYITVKSTQLDFFNSTHLFIDMWIVYIPQQDTWMGEL